MSDSISDAGLSHATRKAPTALRPYARPVAQPLPYPNRSRPIAGSAPTPAVSPLVAHAAPVDQVWSHSAGAPEETTLADLELPWVTVFQDEPKVERTEPDHSSDEEAKVPTLEIEPAQAPSARVPEGWLLQDSAAKLAEISSDPRAFARSRPPADPRDTALPEWNDEDLVAIMSAGRRLSSDAATAAPPGADTEAAARALESLAGRVRSRAIALPPYPMGQGDAAVVAALMLALVSVSTSRGVSA